MGLERDIALRYLRAKRRSSLVSLISVLAVGGVGLGVAALIVVLAVLSGFETNLRNKLLGLSAHVTVYKAGANLPDWPEVVEKIRRTPGVASALPFVNGQVMISSPLGANGVLLVGLDPESSAEAGFFDHLNLSPWAAENLTARPMIDPWLGATTATVWDDGAGDWAQESPAAGSEKALEDGPAPDDGGGGGGGGGDEAAADAEGLEAAKPTPALIIGRELALMLGVEAMSHVSLISPFGRVTPLGNRAPLSRVFAVAGTFAVNYYDFDSRVVYATVTEAQDLLGMNADEVSAVEINVDDVYQADRVKRAVLDVLGEDYWARDWMQTNMSLFSALKLEQTAMFVILTLIILVAAFNIASTLIMMVAEKTRDIAVLKAMGASSAQIRRIFTIQGLFVGAVGTLGGLVMGLALCFLLQRYEFISLPAEVYLMNTLPVEIRPWQTLATTAVSILISYLATLYPAAQAARLDPAEALRYE